MRLFISIMILLCVITSLTAEIRAVWVTPWDLDTPEKCDKVIQIMKAGHQNQILAEVRYRSDAMYLPNREICKYPNPDPRCYLVKNSSFDPLSYLIAKAKPENIEVHAWLVIMAASTINTRLQPTTHLYYQHPEWFTWGPNGRMREAEGNMGIFIDPGIPQVQEYIVNMIQDIVVNYPQLDGIHLDYIRYPGRQYGKNPTSLEIYHKETDEDTPVAWQNWRREQVSHLVERIYAEIKSLAPQMALSAAVIANYSEAYNDYGQDWKQWLDGGYIDRVYLMAYTVNDLKMDKLLSLTQSFNHKDRTVIGLRCWADSGTYPIIKILTKLFLVRNYEFAGSALFSFQSLNHNGYWNELIASYFKEDENIPALPASTQNMIFGYVTNQDSLPFADVRLKITETGVETKSDINGFYAFTNLPEGVFQMDVESEGITLHMDSLEVSSLKSVSKVDVLIQPEISMTLAKSVPLDTLSVVLDESPVEKPGLTSPSMITPSQGFDLFTISDTVGIVIIFRNPKEQMITWYISDLKGKVLISKRKTYQQGEVIDSWSGNTAEGSKISDGIYKIIAIPESDGEQLTKSVMLSRRTN
jgi:uncharacterized lipoprotein YddW (UPF0748 family)